MVTHKKINNFAFEVSKKKKEKKKTALGFISNIKLSLSRFTLLIDKMANMSLNFFFFFLRGHVSNFGTQKMWPTCIKIGRDHFIWLSLHLSHQPHFF